MKKSTSDRTLESFRIFPYIAWALVVGFVFFVYNITVELRSVTDQIEAHTAVTTKATLSMPRASSSPATTTR